jgi:2-methylcitrate dehydratase PrpD
MTEALSARASELDVLTRFALEAKLEDVPDEVVDYARHLTLKTIAGMVAGARFDPAPRVLELVRAKGLPPEVRVVGCDFRTSLWEAVFLANLVVHSTETEDDRLEHGVAWDIAIVPVVLTLAGQLGLSGRDTLEAIVIGLEVHSRTADVNGVPMGLYCVGAALGTAAVAARVMGLGPEETKNAMGMALSTASVAELNMGSDAHVFESAMQCLQAIMAVEAAQVGLTATHDMRGFFETFAGRENVHPEAMVGGLGETWSLMDICVKKYPACSCLHRPMDALRELMAEHSFGYDDVTELVAEISPYDTFNDRPHPASVGDAKFSYQHCLGAVLADGNLSFSNIQAIDDDRYAQARAKVSIRVHDDWSHEMLVGPNGVTAKLTDGRELNKVRRYIRGSKPDPLTHAEFVTIFNEYTEGILTPEQASTCVELVGRLEELPDLEGILAIVAPA